jgi:hypothetical protein
VIVPRPILREGITIHDSRPTTGEHVKTETKMTPEVGVSVSEGCQTKSKDREAETQIADSQMTGDGLLG